MFEIGRLCMKTAGREAGKYCVVVKKMDDKFVLVTGPKELTAVKRRRCNINHLEPMMEVLEIKSDAPDSDVLKAYHSSKLTARLGLGGAKPVMKAAPEIEEPPKPPKKAEPKVKETEPKKAEPKPAKKAEPKAAKKEKPEAASVKAKPKPAKKAAPKKPAKAKAKPKAKPRKAEPKAAKKPAKTKAAPAKKATKSKHKAKKK